jgi:hypothetical protein
MSLPVKNFGSVYHFSSPHLKPEASSAFFVFSDPLLMF